MIACFEEITLYRFRHFGFKCLYSCLVIIGNNGINPCLRFHRYLILFHIAGNRHVTNNAFEVLDGTTEVNTPHAFNDDGKLCIFPHGRQGERLLVLHTVNLSNILSVNKHLCEVMKFASKNALALDLGQGRCVNHSTPPHIHFFKSLWFW